MHVTVMRVIRLYRRIAKKRQGWKWSVYYIPAWGMSLRLLWYGNWYGRLDGKNISILCASSLIFLISILRYIIASGWTLMYGEYHYIRVVLPSCKTSPCIEHCKIWCVSIMSIERWRAESWNIVQTAMPLLIIHLMPISCAQKASKFLQRHYSKLFCRKIAKLPLFCSLRLYKDGKMVVSISTVHTLSMLQASGKHQGNSG